MKKACIFVLLFMLFIALFCSISFAEAQSGTCGTGISWTLTADGVLTMQGEGPMEDYSLEYSPWKGQNIVKLVVLPGITHISAFMLNSCYSLEEVTIPEGVTSIGEFAFSYCTNLSSIDLPDTLQYLGGYVFSGSGLVDIQIPKDCIGIGNYVFQNCEALTSIAVDKDNPSYASQEGVLFDKTMTTLIHYPQGKKELSFIVPDNTTTIENQAFCFCNLASIELPDNITYIGDSAFAGSSNLETINLPDGLKSIGYAAFHLCSKLSEIHIPHGVTKIGHGTFMDCSALSTVTIPNSVTSIYENAFDNCPDLCILCGCSSKSKEFADAKGIETIVSHELNVSYSWNSENTQVIATGACNCGEKTVSETVDVTTETTKQPTCEDMGETTYTSMNFENEAFVLQIKKLQDIPALGHYWGSPSYQWSEDNQTITANCICERDNSHIDIETVSASSVITKNPTCETMGETTFTSEAFVNDVFSVQEKTVKDISPLGHDWDTPTYVWADDLSTVTATRVCMRENEHVETETVIVASEIKMQPSCESMGKTKYTSAAFENEAFSVQTKTLTDIDAIGHDWGRPVYRWADDKSVVTATRTCSHDIYLDHVESETVPVTAKVIKAATCDTKGITKYTSADFQNEEFVTQVETITDISALGHNWGEPNYTWSDDNSTVSAERVCTNNPDHVESETVDVTINITKQATCENMGETTYTSEAFENAAFSIQVITLTNIDALGHIVVIDEAVESTCIATGLTEGSHCSRCEKILTEQEVTPLAKHHYAIFDAIPATCEDEGVTSHVECTVCGDLLIAGEKIPPLGHEWGDAVYTWGNNKKTVTANRQCKRNDTHIETETVNTYRLAINSPTQTEAGIFEWISYEFENTEFVVQKTEGGVIRALGEMDVLFLPAALKEIGTEAFVSVSSEAIIVPKECEIIAKRAFANCDQLVYICIPKGVSIAPDALEGCPYVVIDQQ